MTWAQESSTLEEKISLDNRFRLAVSCAAFATAAVLRALQILPEMTRLSWLMAAYSVPYNIVWLRLLPAGWLRPVYFALSALDFAAITAIVAMTGGPQSPFFYLYPLPFLIHALQFDVDL